MVMLKRRIPAYVSVLTFLVGGLIVLLTMGTAHPKMATPPPAPVASVECDGPMLTKRRPGFQFTKPLLYSELATPTQRWRPLVDTIQAIINRGKADGRLQSAAVYVRRFDRGEWISVNGEEEYDPGSLLKMPVLLHYLELERMRPGSLQERYVLTDVRDLGHRPRFEGPHIEPGLPYTVKDLLTFMIEYSDNRATQVLNAHLDAPRFQAMFTELGLPAPDVRAARYPLNVRDLSVFFKTLFNSSYLEPAVSEQALELLSRSTFTDGLRRGVPQGIPMAHKFGESGVPGALQLHESGIVYFPGQPYLITVMTRGLDDERMSAVIGAISEATYRWFSQGNKTAA